MMLAGVAAVPAAGAGAPRSASGGGYGAFACGLDSITRDGWYAVGAPGPGVWSTGMVDNDPCVLLAASPQGVLRRTADGGTTWQTVLDFGQGFDRVFTEGLGSTVVVSEATTGKFLLSNDGGRHFVERALKTSMPPQVASATRIVSVAGAGGRLALLRVPSPIAGTPVHAGPSLYVSPDRGGTWTESTTSATIAAPVAVAMDTETNVILVADGASGTGGVWATADEGGTFTRVYDVAGARDIVVNPIEGGGRVVYVASSGGVYSSVDGGNGWGREGSDSVEVLRPEWGQSGVLTALFHTPQVRPGRSVDAGASFLVKDDGVPADCTGTTLQRTTDVPSYFLLGCADGRAYRYLSSGADFVGSSPPAGGSGGSAGDPGVSPRPSPPPREMNPLRTWKLPDIKKGSGSIAFDGEVLYYGDYDGGDQEAVSRGGEFGSTVHRIAARTGKLLPTFDGGTEVFALDVDRDQRRLFVESIDEMVDTGLTGGKSRSMFKLANSGSDGTGDFLPSSIAYSWDPSQQAFWTLGGDGSSEVYLISRAGRILSTCTFSGYSGGAAVAAAGDGTAYVELEDDMTVLRVSRRCGVMAVFVHPIYAEVPAENDAITCDTNSFPTSAIWIRDGDAKTVTAYEVPGGYCPLPTRMSISAPVRLALLSQAQVCARLRLKWGPPVPDADVALFADGVPLGVGRTDAAGRVCASYSPALQHRVGGSGAGPKPLQGVFLGNRSYRPSTARGALTVLAAPVVPPSIPRGALAAPADPPAVQAPHQPISQPAPHVQAAVRQAQSQAQAQAQGQAQPVSQANPQAVVVAQQQEQPQLAYVLEGDPGIEAAGQWEMSARPRRAPPVAPFGLAACALTMAAACALGYRTSKARAG
jgi:hypothetical protein